MLQCIDLISPSGDKLKISSRIINHTYSYRHLCKYSFKCEQLQAPLLFSCISRPIRLSRTLTLTLSLSHSLTLSLSLSVSMSASVSVYVFLCLCLPDSVSLSHVAYFEL